MAKTKSDNKRGFAAIKPALNIAGVEDIDEEARKKNEDNYDQYCLEQDTEQRLKDGKKAINTIVRIIKTFLNFLGLDIEKIKVEAKKPKIGGHELQFDSIKELAQKAYIKNQDGFNINLVLKSFSNSGKSPYWASARYLDPNRSKLKHGYFHGFEPNFNLKVGKNRYIHYWCLNDTNEVQADEIQDLLIKKINGEPSDYKLERHKLMLLPGFQNHQCKNKDKTVEVIECCEDPNDLNMSAVDFAGCFSLKLYEKPTPIKHEKFKPDDLKPEMMPKLINNFVNGLSNGSSYPIDAVLVYLLTLISSRLVHKIYVQDPNCGENIIAPNLRAMTICNNKTIMSSVSDHITGMLSPLITNANEKFERQKKSELQENIIHDIKIGIKKNIAREKLIEAESTNDIDKKNKLIDSANQGLDSINLDKIEYQRKIYITKSKELKVLTEIFRQGNNSVLLDFSDGNELLKQFSNPANTIMRHFYKCTDSCFNRFDFDTSNELPVEDMLIQIISGITPTEFEKYMLKCIEGSADTSWLTPFKLIVYLETKGCGNPPSSLTTSASYKLMQNFIEAIEEHDFNFENKSSEHNKTLAFNESAIKLYEDWCNSFRQKLSDQEKNYALKEKILGLIELVPTIALMYEIVDSYDIPTKGFQNVNSVDVLSVKAAIAFAEYLVSHARKIFDMEMNQAVINANLIATRLAKVESPFTARDIAQRAWAGIGRDIDKVNSAISLLEENNWIEVYKTEKDKVGRPTIYWKANPKALI